MGNEAMSPSPRSTSPANVIRGRLAGLARGWGSARGPLALLACPPGELHDLSLMMFGIVLNRNGWRVEYLGANTPIPELVRAVGRSRPELVVVAATTTEALRRDPRPSSHDWRKSCRSQSPARGDETTRRWRRRTCPGRRPGHRRTERKLRAVNAAGTGARAREILVLGATGYVGGRLVCKLLDAGYRGTRVDPLPGPSGTL